MLIWDTINNGHRVRINGEEKIALKLANFNVLLSEKQIEDSVKAVINSKTKFGNKQGYHAYVHITSKSPLRYNIWLGRESMEPEKNWWEG